VAELHLIHGADEALVGQAATDLVRRLVGSADRSLMVADLTIDGVDVTAGHVVAEAQTPPFLTDTRVVVVRGAERLDADGVAALQAYLGAPLPKTDLVLIYAGKPTKKLLDVVKGAGGVVAAPDVGSNRRDRSSFVDEQVAASGLRLTTAATAALVDQLGEDVNRLSGILDTLVATFGTGSRLDVDDVTPYLGEGGGIPPWDLTDAIDRGDRPAALGALSRMVHAGGRHPLVVMAILHTHYGRLLRLDGSGAHDEASAGAVLGLKGFAARKAVERARAMGPDAIHSAIQLMAQADMDLRGQRELPEEAVLEVLVARLCRLSATRRASTGARR
jgi:DNA polymerase III subunit delta